MNRRMFGWDLPPGVTSRMIDEAYGQEGPCMVCCKSVDLCICPECPVCEAQGDPKCYANSLDEPRHGLHLTRAQVISRQEARIVILQQRVQDEQIYLSWLEGSCDQETFDLSDSPDPYK